MMLEKKIAAVTGAASGIGQAIAQRFGKEGACVALLDINYEQAQKTAEEICAAGGKAMAIKTDITKRADVFAAAEKIEKEWGL